MKPSLKEQRAECLRQLEAARREVELAARHAVEGDAAALKELRAAQKKVADLGGQLAELDALLEADAKLAAEREAQEERAERMLQRERVNGHLESAIKAASEIDAIAPKLAALWAAFRENNSAATNEGHALIPPGRTNDDDLFRRAMGQAVSGWSDANLIRQALAGELFLTDMMRDRAEKARAILDRVLSVREAA